MSRNQINARPASRWWRRWSRRAGRLLPVLAALGLSMTAASPGAGAWAAPTGSFHLYFPIVLKPLIQPVALANGSFEADTAASFGAKVAQMFVEEWRRQGRTGRPRTIAIVDDAPEQQHLYPEFRLAKALLDAHGLDTVIADPAAFRIEDGQLTLGGQPIDLVYNRLVDFALADAGHAVLRTAYESGATVVSPNPHIHALLADKRNLALLSDVVQLRHWGLAPNALAALVAGVPLTVVVSQGQAEDLWARRRELFFKPAGGHGSKAAYRGDKLTHKVWAQILEGDYVAQTLALPSGRGVMVDGQRAHLKVDFRLYTYAGAVLLAAARLYQGQTTNMRTPGGGFAPVLTVPAAPDNSPDCGCSATPGVGSEPPFQQPRTE